MTRLNSALLLLLLWASPCFLRAQVGRVDEKAVKIEEQFIDANREKLLGNYENAIDMLKGILKEDRENAAAAFELARAYEAEGDTPKAIRYAENAVEWEQDNIWYHKFLASLYKSNGEDEKAAELYEAIVELQPEVEEHYFRHAYFLVRANEVKDALKVYDQLEERLGISEEVIRRKHALYLGMGNNKKAAAELKRLIEAFPKDMSYRHLLAEFYTQVGQKEEAEKVYKAILRLDPDNAKAELALAGQSVQETDEIRYLKSLQSAFLQEDASIDPKMKKLIPFIRKVAENGDKQLADAALQLTSILQRVHPAEAKAYSAAGDLLYHSGRKQQAIEQYLKTIELDDTKFSVWEQAMRAYQETYQYEALRDFAERAMDYYPNQTMVYYQHAYAQQALGELEDALGTLEQAYFMAGGNAYIEVLVRSLQGAIYNKMGQAERSDKAFEQALQKDSSAPPALSRYAYALAQRGERLKDAQSMALRANELLPKQPEYQANLARVLYKMEQYEEAQPWMERALKNGGQLSPRILEESGDLLYKLGQKEQAVKRWKKAQQLGRSSNELDQKITEGKLN